MGVYQGVNRMHMGDAVDFSQFSMDCHRDEEKLLEYLLDLLSHPP